MSGKGVTHWLSLLGVRYFETHGPSELEYDPQISVVAEFRALDTLFQDHVDNAITDALLELAEQGQTMPYSRLNLPVARLAKTYSWVLNQFGKVGPVPEGMSAVTALRVQALNARHEAARRWIITEAETFFAKNGYRPPYWKLVEMARIALRKP